ncbi:hypothetical protein KIN20_001562 [Parelaphostrongylus tenuis]|uniref:Uncharacterized protein n=1 Tax=Parelaphostrongylus tenuis TaxID=148309 RepID=A0AAD5QEQ5_PARTN|nr:hypothetical protein KIN20_001562 [Parelaphostrongylus tenuis]
MDYIWVCIYTSMTDINYGLHMNGAYGSVKNDEDCYICTSVTIKKQRMKMKYQPRPPLHKCALRKLLSTVDRITFSANTTTDYSLKIIYN